MKRKDHSDAAADGHQMNMPVSRDVTNRTLNGQSCCSDDTIVDVRTEDRRVWNALEYLVVAAAAVACFWNSLDGRFVHDDLRAIVGNRDVVRPDMTSLTELIVHDFWGDAISSNRSHKSYRPLTVVTFRSEASSGLVLLA